MSSNPLQALPVVGFIGIGKMGLPMALHLRRAGYTVNAYDLLPANALQARVLGCAVSETLGGCASQADVLFSFMPNDAALDAITGADGVLAQAKPGMIYVDTSTVSPALSARVATRAAEAGVPYVRCTVSGNPVTAKAAALTVMASGPRASYDRVKPLLATFGNTHFYVGEAEQARVIKRVVNLMVAVSAGMLGEALALGEKSGLDWKQMLDIIGKSAVGSPLVNYKVPPLAGRDYSSTFSGMQMIKDLDLILGQGAAILSLRFITTKTGDQHEQTPSDASGARHDRALGHPVCTGSVLPQQTDQVRRALHRRQFVRHHRALLCRRDGAQHGADHHCRKPGRRGRHDWCGAGGAL